MVDKSKQRKKGTISEDDVSSLLQRYSVKSVLLLLQEVAQAAGEKIDWHAMVRNTKTGISCAREYQMLWRHLAYGETLNDQVELDGNTMDDDSDLEYELEAFPAVGREASAEAAACVKVLIASGHPNDSNLPNNTTIEAPLTVNIPNNKAPSDSALFSNGLQGTYISIPVSVQKQPQSSGISVEKRPNNRPSGVNLPQKRKRRNWSTEEDTKLTAAVEKYGANWANIARGDFKNDRKASELSQRWASLKKKQGSVKVGTSSQPSETLAAAHRAMSLALMPMSDNLKLASQTSFVGIKPQHQSQKPPALPIHQLPAKRPSVNPTSTTDSMVKAAAVAAGARIATSADASSLLEAARSQNVVHITTGASPVMKSSTANQLPSNVHFIRNGLAKAPISTFSSPKPSTSRSTEAQPIKPPAVSAVQPNQKAVASASATVVKDHQGANAPADRVPESQLEEVGKNRASGTGSGILKENAKGGEASASVPDTNDRSKDDRVAENDGKDSHQLDEKSNANGTNEDLPSTV